MKKLLDLIIKNSFSFCFILIELICFVLLFSDNSYQRAKYFNSSNYFTGALSEGVNNISAYFALKTENNRLIEENENLKNRLELYRRDNIPLLHGYGFEYISARVVRSVSNRKRNFLTINKGIKQNVYPEMGVICSDGLVGIIYTSSENYSTILPIINQELRTSVKLKKSDYRGSLLWDSKDSQTALVTEIPGYVEINLGDTIVTSGLSAIFPENIIIGVVSDFSKDKSTDFYNINVKLSTDYNKLSYVYVINNKNYQEQISLDLISNDLIPK